ncbi:hypothetical protein ACKFKG_32975 [Phormidesmis sp. 146-35]
MGNYPWCPLPDGVLSLSDCLKDGEIVGDRSNPEFAEDQVAEIQG